MQLFDSDESLSQTVADFLSEGFRLNDTMLVVMAEHQWYSVAMRLCGRGLPVDQAIESGDVTVLSAEEMLARFMRNGRPDPALFAASTAKLVSALAERGRPLRIYGEMVDLLAGEGEYVAAAELEELWTGLGTRQRFTLLCGYSAAHFGDPRQCEVLGRICASHDRVQVSAEDVLGSFLVRRHIAA